MIKKAYELTTTDKKIRMLIAGYPGIGKTTLGLSAPKPLLIDADRGLDRVQNAHKTDFIQPESYEELMADLTPDNLKDYETLVFDTGGQLFKFMGDYAKKQNSVNGQKDGSLSLKGYGAVARLFENLMNRAYYELNKNVVVLFHAKEEKDGGDVSRLRILVEGSTKDNVWQPMDLGGFIEIHGDKRVISFKNTERHFGKCCHGIPDKFDIPLLDPSVKNDFLTKLFAQVNENMKKDAEFFEEQRKKYLALMDEAKGLVEAVTDLETAKQAADVIKSIEHIWTSRTEISSMFKEKIESLGIEYRKEEGDFFVKQEQETADDAQSA